MAAPPLARDFTVASLAAFDDPAMRAFLDPRVSGVAVADLGLACAEAPESVRARIRRAVAVQARPAFDAGLERAAFSAPEERAARAAQLVADLFWPLVYWNLPGEYEELVAGEQINADLLRDLDLDGRVVADIGAGSGRFALYAATRAQQVIAVDAVPALLERLSRRARDAKLRNVTALRGDFCSLPLPDASVDVAVACSSFTQQSEDGCAAALREAERVVRPDGQVAVIWPQDASWFVSRGYVQRTYEGNATVHFRDVATALRLAALFYSDAAAAWIAAHHTATVPYTVLGVAPPNIVCVKRIA